MAKSIKQTACPVCMSDYIATVDADAIMAKVMDEIAVSAREFSSGGFGLYGGGKVSCKVNGHVLKHQVSVSIVAIGSKDAPRAPKSKELADKAEAIANS